MPIIITITKPQEDFKVKNVEPNFSNISKALGVNIDTIPSGTVINWYWECDCFTNSIEDLDEYGYDKEAKETIQNKMQHIIDEMNELESYIIEHREEI